MTDPRWTDDALLPAVDDEAVRSALGGSRPCSVVIVRAGPRGDHPDRDRLVREHTRRSLRLRAAGLLAIVLPVDDDTDVHEVGVFDLDPDGARAAMAVDPAVEAGVLSFEVHPGRGFPGDRLPVAPEPDPAPAHAPRPVEHRHRDGSLWGRGSLLDGEQHGDWEWFRTDGSRMRTGAFDRGVQVGVWTTYDRQGAVVRRTSFPGPAGSATDHTTDDPHAGEA